jgi:hypothetical protein
VGGGEAGGGGTTLARRYLRISWESTLRLPGYPNHPDTPSSDTDVIVCDIAVLMFSLQAPKCATFNEWHLPLLSVFIVKVGDQS